MDGRGRRGLRKLGYSVHTASSGREALEVYRATGGVDLVILDMIMPDMGGGEAFERLKDLDPGVKVLLSSGYSLEGEAQEILARGCAGFIQKPFDADEIAGRISELVGPTRG